MKTKQKFQSIYKMSGTIVPLTAGSYKVSGWRQKGDYETVTFVISPGENKEIVLRAK